MRAKVLRSFVSNQPRVRASIDEIIELPEDVDWVQAGLVEVLPDEPKPEIDLDELNDPEIPKKYQNRLKKLVEDAALHTPEKAVSRSTGSRPKAKVESKKPVRQSKPSTRKGQGQATAPTK
jgi:hypothetical protein